MSALLLLSLLTGYIYDQHDWLNMPSMARVVSISSDIENAYIAAPRCVYEIEKSNRRLVRTITAADGIHGEIMAISYDPEIGMLWILTTENLFSINPFSDLVYSYNVPGDHPNSLGIGRGYTYVMGDRDHYRMDKRSGVFDTMPPGNDVLWHGPRANLSASDYPFLAPFVYFDAQLNQHPITTVYPESHRLWVGTDGYGIVLYSLATRMLLAQWRLGPAQNRTHAILNLDGNLWFAGNQELARYSPRPDTWAYFPIPYNVFYLDSSLLLRSNVLDLNHNEPILALVRDTGGYWLGTDEGLYFYNLQKKVITPMYKLNAGATSIQLTADSAFIGTDVGLIRYNRHTGQWSMFNDTMQQMHFGVFGIASTSRRRYYGVYGGIETQDSTGDWQMMLPPGYLLSNHPNGLAATPDKLFIATDQGVVVYNEKNGSYTTLNKDVGLLSNEVASLYADDDYLWIATDAGISRFNYHALFP